MRQDINIPANQRPLNTHIANIIVNVAVDQGVAREDLLARTAFNERRLLDTESSVTYPEMFELIDQALEMTGNPALGIDVGLAETVGSWGVLGYALMSCANEIEATRIGTTYYRAAPSLTRFYSSFDGRNQFFQIDPIYPDLKFLPFCFEEKMVGICKVASEYLVEPISPLEIKVTYDRPRYADRFESLYDCPITYNASINAFWTREPTDRPLRGADPASAALCLQLVEQLVEKHSQEDRFIFHLRRRLMQNPGSMPSIHEVASELAMSARTLRRRLDELNASFSGIQQDVRMNLALDYLQNAGFSVQQTAHMLGYSETTNFRRAFKKWKGQPPSDYLRQA